MDETSLTIRIDDRLEDYRPMFDARWAADIERLARRTKLAGPVSALVLNWRAAANTCAMPWLTVHSLSGHWNAFLAAQEPFSERLTKTLADRLAVSMGDAISHSKRKRLAEAVEQIGREIQAETHEAPAARREVASLWAALLEDGEFQLALWGSQRIGYGSIYHSYEDFVRQCISLALGKPEYRGQRIHALIRDASRTFGKRIADYCLADHTVRTARLVRNALAHGGGKETAQLRATSHEFVVENSTVQILASDTRELYDRLKRRALRLVEKGSSLPELRQSGL